MRRLASLTEPCIQGHNGSGSVFFSGCNLRCTFCQNHDIAHQRNGFDLTPEQLAEWYIKLQDTGGVHNINLVTPEHVVPQVALSILAARDMGLTLPIIYNTSAFDSLESLELMDGLVDIYLPDFKVWSKNASRRLLKADDYAAVARESIQEMHRQVGDLCFTADGIAKKGLLVRHLIMPGKEAEAEAIMGFLAEHVSKDVFVNIMEQYRPAAHVGKPKKERQRRRQVTEPGGVQREVVEDDVEHVRYAEINRPVTEQEVSSVRKAAEQQLYQQTTFKMGSGRRMKRKQRGDIELTQKNFPKKEGGAPAAKKRKTATAKTGVVPANRQKKAAPKPAVDEDDDEFDVDAINSDELEGEGFDEDSVFDSDEEEQQLQQQKKEFLFSDDEDDDSDREERLTAANIEGLTRKLDEQMAEEAAAAEAELQEAAIQTNIGGEDIFADDEEGGKPMSMLAPDLQLLRSRINDVIRILGDFSKLAEPGRSRAEYTAQVLKDISAYYGYSPFMAEKLWNLFPPQEAFAFFEANETPRPVVIRTNTLKTHRRELAQALINRGVTLEPVGKWSKVGLQVFDTTVPLGATPEYLSGHYILQAASSFLPVMALQPQPNERILDMASAPGGKTTYCSAMMNNTGVVFANDPNKARAKGLIGNIHRLGVRNTIVCSYDAKEFPKVMGGFDRVLLDAPCSGTGVISKDPSVKTSRTEKDFIQLPHLQKQLLLAAIDSVNHASKTGGIIVYSTCSVTVDEDESVVQYALRKRPNVRLVDTGIPFGREGYTSYMGKNFGATLKLTKRFFPHTVNMDGFFVAKFQKVGPSPKESGRSAKADNEDYDMEMHQPVLDEDDEKNGAKNDDFGGFDEDEDENYIERAKHNAMRRRGFNPRADSAKQVAKKEESKKEVTKEDVPMEDVPKDEVAKKVEAKKEETSKKATPKKDAPKKETAKKETSKKGSSKKGASKKA
ncbi:25S rRNA (cytosine-C(5))-methyltransferase [Apiospora saccharicola]|uniref:25S rRNA (Cytosine-C(5))-methyltransferase n=1 Tax=Apiospora saccharicola TaxID=335842 RepID=A0ABR1UL60_9PEZI